MRRLALAAFSFAAGIFAAQYLLPGRWQLGACAAALALGLLIGFLAFPARSRARARIFLLSVGFAAGCAYNWCYTAVVQTPAEQLAGTERPFAAVAADYAVPTEQGARITLILWEEGLAPVRVIYYGQEDLLQVEPGNLLRGIAAVESAATIRDEEINTFTSKGVFLLLYARGEPEREQGSADSPRWWPVRTGHAMREQICKLFSGDTAGFLTAMLTGDKTGLSESAASDLSEAGIYHILAISGLHCAFLLAVVEFFTGRQRRRLTAAVAIPVLVFYAVLAGCSPSVLRACIMLIALLAAPLFRRERDGTTAMALALALILLLNPFAAASISLQLSFAAIAGILWAAPWIFHFLCGEKPVKKWTGTVYMSLSVSLGVIVFSAPLAAIYFGIFWLILPLSNFLCLWAAGMAFSVGLPAVLVSFLWLPLGKVLAFIPKLLISYVLAVAGLMAKIPYHAVYFTNPYLKYWLAAVYVLFAIAVGLGPKIRRKYWLAAALSALMLVAAVWAGSRAYTGGRMDATVLDVGQGQSIVLSSGGEFALIDCGSSNSWYDAGDIASDTLQSMGCRTLRYLCLTHCDYDHVSGVERVLARTRVETLILPNFEDDAGLRSKVMAAARASGTEICTVQTSADWKLGSLVISVDPSLGTSDNDRGLVFLCSEGEYDLLVTGDLSSAAERALLEDYDFPDIEALIVGHHGSKNATSSELLESLQPETGIISVGANSYGQPAAQTLQRLVSAGLTIYRTDLQGNIHLRVN